ncbi:MAG: peptidylprolyl isomerase [Vicingaceae bacterium]
MRSIKLIILSALVSFAAYSYGQKAVVLDKVIGVVGDEIATKYELENQFTSMVAQGMEVTDNSRCQIFEDILFAKMLLNQARLDSIEVSEAQIEGEMDRRMRYYIGMMGSEEAVEKYYKKTISQLKDDLRPSMREQMLIQGMRGEITADVKVTPAEVEEYFNSIPEDSLPLINAEVEMAQIVAHAPTSRESIKAVKDKLREYKQRVEEGERFSTLAVLYSEDPGSAEKGGEIGFVGKAEVAPEFGAAAFQLKSGQVSPIIKTDFGYHIIQMIERRGTKVNVRHILMKPKLDAKAMNKAKQKLDSVAKMIQKDSLDFGEAARQFSEDENTKKNGGIIVNPATASSMTPMDDLDPALFFVIDKLEEGEISKPVELQDPRGKPGYRLIKLVKRTTPHRANMKDDYQKIKQAALAEKEQKVLQEWVGKTMQETYLKLDKKYTDGCEFMQPWIENTQ